MNRATKLLTAVFGAALMVGGGVLVQNYAPSAIAQTTVAKEVVDAAKTQGLVGETIDGYLAIVDGETVSEEIQAAVNEINIRRKSLYTQLARELQTSPENVAGVSGEKLVAKAKPGEKVKLSDEAWHIVN